jgi:hypothetical protein
MADKTTCKSGGSDKTFKSQAAAERANHKQLAHTIVKPDGSRKK